MMASHASQMAPDPDEILTAVLAMRPSGGLLLCAIDPTQQVGVTGRSFLMPDEASDAVSWAVEKNTEGFGIYWTPNHASPELCKKAAKSDILAASYFWADCDPNLFAHGSYEAARDHLLRQLAPTHQATASLIVDSGHGIQIFWRINPPIQTTAPESLKYYEDINEAVGLWGEGPGTYNADRVMRLPGTINYVTKTKLRKGYPEATTMARLLHASGAAVRAEQMREIISASARSAARSELERRFLEVLRDHPNVRDRWDGGTDGLLDATGSGMDMSMVGMLRSHGFTYDETRTLMADWRHGSVGGRAQGERHWQRMWERCHAGQETPEAPPFAQPGAPHPLLQFSDYVGPQLEAPEFIIDGLIQAGIVMIAGASGVGKTTCLVPLFAAAAHLCPADFPFRPRIKRRVLYVAEDVGQAKRVIHSLRHFGGVPGGDAEWQDMFRLVQAQRMSAAKIVEIADACLELAMENISTETGVIYQAPPVIVLDTANATINLDNENDNAEVGKAIALLKHRFARIPLVIVAHTTKANKRADAAELSARGAGAWEADTQQSLVLFMDEADENSRYMMLGKKRFETSTKEVKFASSSHSVVASNVLGEPVEITVRHSIATSCAAGEREQARADAKERVKSVERFSRLQKAVSLVAQANKAGDIITKSDLAKQLGGRRSDALEEIDGLIDDGELAEVPVPVALRGNNRRQFHLVTREVETARKYRGERGE